MGIENLTTYESKRFADIETAREYGYLRMGVPGFDSFVHQFSANKRAIQTINGRLITRHNNVHILASVDEIEELAVVQAAVLSALDNPEIYVATIISEYQRKYLQNDRQAHGIEGGLEAAAALSAAFFNMGGRNFYEDDLTRESLVGYAESLPHSLLLVSQPAVISDELSQSHFGYRWHVDLDLDRRAWRVGDIEVVTKMN